MPKCLQISEIPPGFALQQDFLGPTGQTLFRKLIPLTERVLRNLERISPKTRVHVLAPDELDIRELFVPGLFECEEMRRTMTNLREATRAAATCDPRLPQCLESTVKAVGDTVDCFFHEKGLYVPEWNEALEQQSSVIPHLQHTMIVSMVIAKEMERSAEITLSSVHLRDMCVGALFHDLSLANDSPAARFEHETKDPRSGIKATMAHVRACYRMVSSNSFVLPVARNCILHHHQWYDGKGVPPSPGGQLAKDHIPPAARIVATADLYATFCEMEPRAFPVDILKKLKDFVGTRLDPKAYESLCRVTPPYPRGTYVVADTGVVYQIMGVQSPDRVLVRQEGMLRGEGHLQDMEYQPTEAVRKRECFEVSIRDMHLLGAGETTDEALLGACLPVYLNKLDKR